jgi:hypothetical protein
MGKCLSADYADWRRLKNEKSAPICVIFDDILEISGI